MPVLVVVSSRPRYDVRRWLHAELVTKHILALQATIVRQCELAYDFGCLRRHQVFNLLTKMQSLIKDKGIPFL